MLLIASGAAGSEGMWLAVYTTVGESTPSTLQLNGMCSHLLSFYYQSPYYLLPNFKTNATSLDFVLQQHLSFQLTTAILGWLNNLSFCSNSNEILVLQHYLTSCILHVKVIMDIITISLHRIQAVFIQWSQKTILWILSLQLTNEERLRERAYMGEFQG